MLPGLGPPLGKDMSDVLRKHDAHIRRAPPMRCVPHHELAPLYDKKNREPSTVKKHSKPTSRPFLLRLLLLGPVEPRLSGARVDAWPFYL